MENSNLALKLTNILRRLRLMPRHSGNAFEKFYRVCMASCASLGVTHPAQIAYIFATVEHETNGTFQPVREAYWLSEAALIRWLVRNKKDYVEGRWWGRGHTQNTWKANYQRIDDAFQLNGKLLRDPDLLLRDYELSVLVSVAAMQRGWYTVYTLDRWIGDRTVDLIGARRIVNGTDKAEKIAHLAAKYLVVLAQHEQKHKRMTA